MASVWVSILAMSVIFLVLSVLIGVIKVLVHFMPYVEPPAPPAKPKAAAPSAGDESELIAAVHAVLAHHLGKSPQDFSITKINPR